MGPRVAEPRANSPDNPPIRITFHIGMGKTGTSAIQSALERNPDRLREHGVGYLGMWWDVLDPRFEGPRGMSAAARLDEAQLRALADRLLAHVRMVAARDGVRHFVFSNESLFSHTDAYAPVYARLAEHVDVDFVVFVREPRQWLASAYAQWGIRHKVDPGPVPDFGTWAAGHIGIYGGLRWWHQTFGPRLVVRTYDPSRDAVAEFLDAIGCEFELESRRIYQTPEPALLLLQAAYNSLFEQPVRPAKFASEVYDGVAAGAPPRLEDAITRHFDQSAVPGVLEHWRAVFEGIRDDIGIDLLAAGVDGLPSPDPAPVRDRMLDCLMAITLQQARRISELEARLQTLEGDTAGST